MNIMNRVMPKGFYEAYDKARVLGLSCPRGRALYACNRRQCAGIWYHLGDQLRSTREDTAIRWLKHWRHNGSIRSIHKTQHQHDREVRDYVTTSKLPKRDFFLTPSIQENITRDQDLLGSYVASTQPADRYQAEDAIYQLYKKLRLSKPTCVWGNSPFESAQIASQIRNKPYNLAQSKLTAAGHAIYQVTPHEIYRDLIRRDLGIELGTELKHWQIRNIDRQIRRTISVRNRSHDLWWNCNYNQFNLADLAVFEHFPETQDLIDKYAVHDFISLMKSCGWYWTFNKICVLTDRPTEFHIEKNQPIPEPGFMQLHNENGPAIAYRDGWGIYAWHGIPVPSNVILEPESISLSQIKRSRNVEVRRQIWHLISRPNRN